MKVMATVVVATVVAATVVVATGYMIVDGSPLI